MRPNRQRRDPRALLRWQPKSSPALPGIRKAVCFGRIHVYRKVFPTVSRLRKAVLSQQAKSLKRATAWMWIWSHPKAWPGVRDRKA